MRTILAAVFVGASFFALGAVAAPSYVKLDIVAAQEALIRLGYDVGKPDGKWGGKSRKAMNDLREKNGLPPANDFTGSSLALIHKLSPGEATLPHPGLLVVGAAARRAELQSNPELAAEMCAPSFGIGRRIQLIKPRDVVVHPNTGADFVAAKDDYYSSELEAIVAATDNCLAGEDKSCQAVIDFAEKAAAADAYAPASDPPTGTRNEDLRWIGNLYLKDIALGYGIARQFAPLPVDREAVVLDWLKRRIDQYHSVNPDNAPPGDPHGMGYTNHAVTHRLPAMIFGIMVGDDAMVEPALETYRGALRGIREDGSIPTESRRGAAWFSYSNLQIAQLLAVRDLARAQGIHADAGVTGPRFSIPHAVEFVVAATQDFDLARKYAKANEGPSFGPAELPPLMRHWQIGWIPSYIAQYGDDDTIEALLHVMIDEEICSSSQSEDRLDVEGRALCKNAGEGGQVSLAKVMMTQGARVNHFMGYGAGCFESDKSWTEIFP